MTVALYTFYQKSPAQIKSDILRVISNGLKAQGIASPNVGPNSDYDLIATALANELAVIQSNNVVLADQLMPDTAGGAYLDRWLAVLGLARNPAIGASGLITPLYNATSTTVPTGAQLTDSAGLRYQVTVGGVYGTAGGLSPQIPIQAIDTGAATNHFVGDTLSWVSAPPFTGPTVTVYANMTNGANSEVGQDEPPRARLLSRFGNPPGGGNWSQVAQWCLQSSPYVNGAGVYPALNGPGTVYVAVFGAPSITPPYASTSKNRSLSAAIMSGTVQPYVSGRIPEYAFASILSVANQPCDVAMLISLPASPAASPPGPGGGWIDGSPWPTTSSGAPVTVTGVSSTTSITVNAQTPASPLISHVAWLNPANWTLYTALVTSCTGSPGAFSLMLDTPWPGIVTGSHVFPQSQNQATYVTAIFAAFANLGPGEWAQPNSAGIVRGFRHPLPSLTQPYALDANFLRIVQNAGNEVQNVQFAYRSLTQPTVPANYTIAPNILVPRNISIYAQ